jgi:hypothetical protein
LFVVVVGVVIFFVHLWLGGDTLRIHCHRDCRTIGNEDMSSAKQKAKEMVDKFTVVGLQQRNEGIQCALIAVESIIDNIENKETPNLKMWYWEAVKKEIELL